MPCLLRLRPRLLSLRPGTCNNPALAPTLKQLRHSNRPFTSLPHLRAAPAPAGRPASHLRPPPASKSPPTTTTTTASKTSTASSVQPRRPVPRSYAETLAARGQPTLLYEAPSHFWLRFSCFSAGAFCVSYTVAQYWTIYLHPPEGLSWWVPHAYGVVLIFMAGMGAWFATSAGGIVRRIRAIPTAAAAASTATNTASISAAPELQAVTARASAAAAAPLLIEVATTRPFPFWPDKQIRTAPTEIKMPFRVAQLMTATAPGDQRSAAEKLRSMREEQERKEKARKYELDHIMTAPFRHAGRGAAAAFRGVKRGLNREGFAAIRINGGEYKFDATGGWALDNGKALDRIVHVRMAEAR